MGTETEDSNKLDCINSCWDYGTYGLMEQEERYPAWRRETVGTRCSGSTAEWISLGTWWLGRSQACPGNR